MPENINLVGELQARIKALEAGTRKLQIMCALLLLLGILTLYQNFSSRYQILDSNGSLNIRDDREQPRAILHAEDFNSALTFYDADDQDRAMLGATQDGSGLTLRDENASIRIILRANDRGPEMVMTDDRGHIRLKIGVGEIGSQILMYDAEGREAFNSSDLAPSSEEIEEPSLLAGTPLSDPPASDEHVE